MIEKICLTCNNKFYVNKARENSAKYCSKECRKVRFEKTCEYCKKTYYINDKAKIDSSKYCSKQCYSNAQRVYKTCENCGKVFNKSQNERFCSRKCLKEGTRKYEEKECTVCKKTFYTSIPRVTMCSRECKAIASRKYKKCPQCNKEYYGANRRGKYCSQECKTQATLARKKRTCPICKSSFYATYEGQKTCSIQCGNALQGSNKVELECVNCQRIFKLSPSLVNLRGYTAKYCSIECRNKHWEKSGWSKLRQLNAEQQLHKPTKLELLGYRLLEELGVEFHPQFEVKEKFLVDAFIPNGKIVIQFDGDYWHGNPIKYPLLNERQKKQRLKDESQNKYLIACGYKVIRIWESDIKANPNCLESLLAINKQ